MSRWRLALPVSALLAFGCGKRPADSPEDLLGLRALGVQASPLVSAPTVAGEAPHVVTLTVFASAPLGTAVQIEPFRDDGVTTGTVVLPASAINVDASTAKYEAHDGLAIYSATATITIPPAEAFPVIKDAATRASQVRYGIALSTPQRTEKIIGDVIVYPAGSPELLWKDPAITVTTPTDGGTVNLSGDNDLSATTTDTNAGDDIKLGWFVSGGTVDNRRADDTTWSLAGEDPGAKTLVVTAHGSASRGFALQVLKVTAQ